ncbi:Leucine-rich repeat protein [Cordyceps fumosorosea ARSEF 2679]|uniref:Leucine-rich repeat protein n=1 Tax=Cordyceps fumosorosea (strain ARSEF 2679) TaxID=1081104 RepID=A0A162MUF9_CORFA|nr:Leucine-rich repeat protein [Cordyceps fumosorosea ARSEF 2679]OAA70629.1 Leucine-rich repeat protein [Cordyceps fumosorosea ARSEF 2679]
MDAPSQRPGASRASRLPVPRASGIPRLTFSTAIPSSSTASPARTLPAAPTGPAGTHELHNPKVRKSLGGTPLRAAGSREQLRTASVSRPLAQSPALTRVSSTSQRRTSLFVDRVPSRASAAADRDVNDLAGSRRASRAGLLPDDDDTSPVQEYTPYNPTEDTIYLKTPNTQSTKPRPSLSERTMETLANIPSSPAMNRKPSSILDQARPRSRSGSVSSRPGSSYNSDGSGRPQSRSSSRPGSRAENDGYPGAYKSALSTIDGTPEREKHRGPVRTPNSRISMKPSLASASRPLPFDRSPSPDKQSTQTLLKSRPAPAKSLKSKASSNGLFKKPALPAAARNTPGSESGDQSWDGAIAPLTITKTRGNASEDRPGLAHRKSSAALRDQIAKAKAARKASTKLDTTSNTDFAPISMGSGSIEFDIEEHPDPFGQNKSEPASAKVLQQRIAAGRTTGRLNIAALGLKEMPIEVLNMYNLESMSGGGTWAESVDLTRLVAADNSFETLDDVLFPDVMPTEFDMDNDDDATPNIFGGLETMDLHGNKLAAVPIGFRRLSQLTSLNLSKNNLDSNCLQILSQMTALRDLKLASNNLSGPLNAAISLLDGLEVLDLHDNKLSSLPQDMHKMTRLRILDLGENSFEAVSFADLADLPLSQLVLRKNKLTGTLIEAPIEEMRTLQTLDISCNQIKYLMPSATIISFPALHTLSASMNRLQELPDMSSWSSLLTLTLDENGIAAIPESFMSLTKLRQVDFSGNDIRVVPPELSRMDSLSMIRLSGNPLRDKKFVTATTDELKEILAGRLEPPPPYQEQSETVVGLMGKLAEADIYQATTRHIVDDDAKSDAEDDFTTPPTSRPHSPSRSRSQTMDSIQTQFHMPVLEDWQVRPGGVLDRSRTGSSVLDAVKFGEANDKQAIKQLLLHHNLFSAIPDSLAIVARSLTSLSLANNQLAGATYLQQPLHLPALKELNLMANRITSLESLLEHLDAPSLETIDISTNRLTCLPNGLLDKFPRLRVLLASNNQISELRPDSIKGLKIIEVASNEIAQLDPRIGLLGGVNGLERLDVSGNRFKVPRWNILEQGTHATLHWLRGRVPEQEIERWREQNGEDD